MTSMLSLQKGSRISQQVDEVQIKCDSHVYGLASTATGTLRVRCKGKFCRRGESKVTFHTFDLATGELLRTEHLPYRSPNELLGQGERP